MKPTICPRCKSSDIVLIGDGNIKCNNCGYMGLLVFDKDLLKRIGK